uniref:FERM domain-containing protein n=2 Tax=Mesocestoides corti TaxID=53468 RepID=A0A5K3EZF2_MESCO
MFENMTPRVEAKIREIYRCLHGLSTAEAEAKFLERASELETYGVEPVFVQDRKGNHFYVGLSHEGVTAFRGNRKAHVFTWSKIHRISFDGKLFIIQVEWERRRHTLGFKCQTTEAAEALWKWAVDRQCFFTLTRSTDAKKAKASGRFFRKRQLYSFTGRCQREMQQMTSSLPNIPQPSVSRSRSLLNIARSVSSSRQTRSQEQLHRSLDEAMDRVPNANSDQHLNSRDPGSEIAAGGVRLAGVASESADQLNVKTSQMSKLLNCDKMYRSSEVIATTSAVSTANGSTSELSPAATSWPAMPPRKPDVLTEVARKEVDEALSHAEIMRLVTRRQSVEQLQEQEDKADQVNVDADKESTEKNSSSPSSVRESGDANHTSPSHKLHSSPRRLDRQGSFDRSPPTTSTAASESFSTQVHCPQSTKMNIDRADTGPSESTLPSSSSTPASSVKSVEVSQSIVVDPPSGFADSPSKGIYFPYLSKVRTLGTDFDGKGHQSMYLPFRFDKPTRDPFSLPSRTSELYVNVGHSPDPFDFSPAADSSIAPTPPPPSNEDPTTEGSMRLRPPRLGTSPVDKSPLLLRHGYAPFRGVESKEIRLSHRVEPPTIFHPWPAVEAPQEDFAAPTPVIVQAGRAVPVEEPSIVAECYVPLGDDDEIDDDDDEAERASEAGRAEVRDTRRPEPPTFDWSAASARVNYLSGSDSPEVLRLPSFSPVVLSQEILSPASGDLSSPLCNPHYPGDDLFQQKGFEPVPLRHIQKTLVQVPQSKETKTAVTRENGNPPPHTERAMPPSSQSNSEQSSDKLPITQTIIQFFWFLLVLVVVHNVLKFIRVGPILGFFGCTGPEAVGYWSALEAFVNFFFS